MTLDLASMAPLAVVIPATATLIAAGYGIQYTRKQRLSDRLSTLFTDGARAGLRAIAEADRHDLVRDAAQRTSALKLLLQFQQIAASVSSSARQWDIVLAHDDRHLLRSAVERASLLIQTVRRTDWNFEMHPWNGSRRHAFTALLRASGVTLPKIS